jgi:hypothetical protein
MTHRLLGGCIALGAGAWLILSWRIKRQYVRRFLATLETGGGATPVHFPDVDGASLQVLIAALESPVEPVALSALALLAAQRRARAIPLSVFAHPSAAVRAKALEVFTESGRRDFAVVVQRLMRHERPEVRIATVRAALALGFDEQTLRCFATDRSPVVRALIAVRIADRGVIDAMAEGPAEVRAALLQATNDPLLVRRLADTSVPSVLRAVSQAIARLKDVSFIPLLISHLHFGASRAAVRATLVRFGDHALDALERALEDPGTDIDTRRQIPGTIGDIGTARAAASLARNLRRQADGVVRYKLLLALSRLVAYHPEVSVDHGLIVESAIATGRRLHQLYAWRTLLNRAQVADARRATDAGRAISSILYDKAALTMQQLFRLMGVLHPRGRTEAVRRAIERGDPTERAAAVEVLDDLLTIELREWVLPLVDDLPEEQRFERIAGRLGLRSTGYDELLSAIATLDDTLAKLVTHHTAELAGVSAA